MNETVTKLDAATIGQAKVAGLLRRLAIIVYDGMLLFGILVMAAALFVVPVLAVTGAATIEGQSRAVFQVWLLAVILAYFGYFWSNGRQTLAMRAWRVRLVRSDGEDLSAADALRRLVLALLTNLPLGAGLFWVLLDPDGLSWYDRLSRTRPVLLAKPKRDRGKAAKGRGA